MGEFRVLMVCTANHCRSPLAEFLLRDQLAGIDLPGTPWSISSAGTDALVGRPMHEYSQQVLSESGITPAHFVGRQITEDIARSHDLILTASREHRAAVVSLVPAVMGRVFTLKQFARLAAAVPSREGADWSEFGHFLVREAKFARSAVQPVEAELEDLQDPIGWPIEAYRRCAAEIELALADIVGDAPVQTSQPAGFTGTTSARPPFAGGTPTTSASGLGDTGLVDDWHQRIN